MLLLIIVGFARSGKDTVADYLQEKHGFKKFVFSDFIVEEVKKRGLPVSKENLSKIGDEMRAKNGMDVVAKRLWEKAKEFEKVVACGARSVEEVEFLKAHADKVFVVKVVASPEKRFERKSPDEPANEKEFFARDVRDSKRKGLQGVLELTDCTIENNSTLNDLKKAIDDIIAKL